MVFNFTRYKIIWFAFSGILVAGSLASLLVFGLNLGIDFTGGSILEMSFSDQRPSNQQIWEDLTSFDLGEIYIQPADQSGMIIRMKNVPEETHQAIIGKLSEKYKFEEKRFESLGPVIGKELKDKTVTLTLVALFSIVAYIAFAFRKVSRPISSWRYGLISLISLSHDVLIPIGAFAVLGKFYGVQVTIPVVVALLTVVGYAINNVVVVFDRVRENLIRRASTTFDETINKSVSQTITRCLNTSLTTLLVLSAIFFFGGATLEYFALTLIIGIVAGIYSSIFLAGPLLTIFKRHA